MSSVGDLVIAVRGTVAPLRGALSAARGILGGFAGVVGTALSPIQGILSSAFDVGHAIEAAGARGRAEKLLASTIASTGGAAGYGAKELVEYAQQLEKTTSFSAKATIGAETMLLTFRNIKGDTFKDATKAAQDLATVTGMDLTQASRVVGKALNDPANSLKLLRKLGVQFTDDQKAQIAAMQASGNMAGAQKMILDQLGGSFGGAAENMASPMAQLRNSVESIAESFGMVLGPMVKSVASALNEMLGPAEETRGSLQSLGKLIGSFVSAVLKPFGQGIAQVAQLLMGMFAGGSVTAADFAKVAQLAMENILLGIMALVPNGEQLFTHLGITIAAVFEGAKAAAGSFFGDLSGKLKGFVEFNSSIFVAIGAAIKAAFRMEDPIAAAKNALKTELSSAMSDTFGKPAEEFKKAFDQTAGNAAQGLKEQGGLKNVLTLDRDKLSKDIKSTIDGLPKLKGFEVPGFKKRDPVASGGGGGGKAKKNKAINENEKLEGFESSSKEALAELARQMRGDADPAQRTADATERIADATEKIADKDDEEGEIFDVTGAGG